MSLEFNTPILLTHLLVGTIGFITGMTVAARSMRRETPMPQRLLLRNVPPGVILILALLLIIVGLGIQQSLWQDSQDDWKKCVNTWANARDEVANKRAEANAKYDLASDQRSTALDTLLVYALNQPDSENRTVKQEHEIHNGIVRLGREYQKKVKTVRETSAHVRGVAKNNPFPELDC